MDRFEDWNTAELVTLSKDLHSSMDRFEARLLMF